MISALLLSLTLSQALEAQNKDIPRTLPKKKKSLEQKTETPINEVEASQSGEVEKTENSFNKAIEATTETVNKALSTTQNMRSESTAFVFLNYSPIDLIIPNKYGATLGLTQSVDQTWEFEYLRGSVTVPFVVKDLGGMTDQRYSLIGRSYLGTNSFNISYGLTYFDFAITLGNEYLSQVSGNIPSVELIDLESIGFNLGIGNRWIFDNHISFGIDWIAWSQPVIVTKKSSAFLEYASEGSQKSDVNAALDLISYMPRFTFFKIQLGLTF